jgi:hypothetical protein
MISYTVDRGVRPYDSFSKMHKAITKNISKYNIAMIFPDSIKGFRFKYGTAIFPKREPCKFYSVALELEEEKIYSRYILHGNLTCSKIDPENPELYELKLSTEYNGVPIEYSLIMPEHLDNDEFEGKVGTIKSRFQIKGYEYYTRFLLRFPTVDEAEWPEFESMYSEISELMFDLVKDYIDSI